MLSSFLFIDEVLQMNNKKRERLRKRMFRVIGTIVAMCLLLTGVGVNMIFAESKELKAGDLIPGSVTIDSPRALSKVGLPKNDYGTLKWKDGTQIADTYDGAYKVVFTASKDCKADFSQIQGFDGKKRTLTGTVTVYVSSLAPEEEETKEEAPSEETEEVLGELPAESTTESQTPEEDRAPENQENAADTQDKRPEAGEDAKVPENTEESDKKEPADNNKENTEDKKEQEDTLGEIIKEDTPDKDKTGNTEEEKPAGGEKPSDSEQGKNDTQDKDAVGSTEDKKEHPKYEEPLENVVEGQKPAEIPDSPMELIEEEVRPLVVSEDMNPEEQAEAAAQNHTCQGITVSGEFLPWYVQFRVSPGSGFGFTNAEDANTFQAYEFQLWDLLNDTEYTIPEGESVQVTMPVAAGYEYSIQHILPDGSTETIVPSVYGNTLVFSTSSFSPFGIAGSKPLVGDDIADKGYGGSNSSSSQNAVNQPSGSSSSSSSQNAVNQPSGNNSSGSSQNVSSASHGGKKTNDSQSSFARPVKTGDETNAMPFVGIGLGALVVIVALVLAVLNKRNKK